jgi:hypothetical protein
VDLFEADVGAGEGEHGFVDVGAACVAAGEVAVGVQPGDRALHDPALASQARAVAAVALGDLRCDAALESYLLLGALSFLTRIHQPSARSRGHHLRHLVEWSLGPMSRPAR